MRSDPATSWSMLGMESSARRCFCLPAPSITSTTEGKVYVDLTKDQIKDSPEFDQSNYNEPDYRNRVGDYYGHYYQVVIISAQ